MLLAVIALFALTRAEIIARMKAPVLTMSQGLVRVYAYCPEDMRRSYQMPLARFACDLSTLLYRGSGVPERRFQRPGIVIHVGSERTNRLETAVRVETNGAHVTTHIYAKSPGHVDENDLRMKVAKAFFRAVHSREIDEKGVISVLRAADPRMRIEDERRRLEEWLKGQGSHDDEEALALMRKVLDPGRASKRDVLVFASRLHLYPETFDRPFVGGRDCITFEEAVSLGRIDPRVRLSAFFKSRELPVFGGGRGEALSAAAGEYSAFLLELARGVKSDEELGAMLESAGKKLREAEMAADGFIKNNKLTEE